MNNDVIIILFVIVILVFVIITIHIPYERRLLSSRTKAMIPLTTPKNFPDKNIDMDHLVNEISKRLMNKEIIINPTELAKIVREHVLPFVKQPDIYVDVDDLVNKIKETVETPRELSNDVVYNLPRSEHIIFYTNPEMYDIETQILKNAVNEKQNMVIFDGFTVINNSLTNRPMLKGTKMTQLTLPVKLKEDMTLCYVLKYDGTNSNNYILKSDNTQLWFSGFEDGKTNIVYHGGEYLNCTEKDENNKNLAIIGIDQYDRYFTNGIERTCNKPSIHYPEDGIQIGINNGYLEERSDFIVGDIIIYDIKLTTDDINSLFYTLNKKYNVYNMETLYKKQLPLFSLRKIPELGKWVLHNEETKSVLTYIGNSNNGLFSCVKFDEENILEDSLFEIRSAKSFGKFVIFNPKHQRYLSFDDYGYPNSNDTETFKEQITFIDSFGKDIEVIMDLTNVYIRNYQGHYIIANVYQQQYINTIQSINFLSPIIIN